MMTINFRLNWCKIDRLQQEKLIARKRTFKQPLSPFPSLLVTNSSTFPETRVGNTHVRNKGFLTLAWNIDVVLIRQWALVLLTFNLVLDALYLRLHIRETLADLTSYLRSKQRERLFQQLLQ